MNDLWVLIELEAEATRIEKLLAPSPAVVILGSRQVGKTTLADAVVERRRSTYLGLESDPDRANLAEPKVYLAEHRHEHLILGQIHHTRSCCGRFAASSTRGVGRAAGAVAS